MIQNNIIGIVRVVILSLILSAAIGYSFAAWVAPSAAPPNGNPPPPINVGDSPQVRNGNLYLNNWLIVKKAQSIDSTVAADGPKILTTKDYVDGKGGSFKPHYFYKNKVCNSGTASGGYYVVNYAAKVPTAASAVIVSAYADASLEVSHLYIKESLPSDINDMIRVVELGNFAGGDRSTVFIPTTLAKTFYIYKTGATTYCLEGYVD